MGENAGLPTFFRGEGHRCLFVLGRGRDIFYSLGLQICELSSEGALKACCVSLTRELVIVKNLVCTNNQLICDLSQGQLWNSLKVI